MPTKGKEVKPELTNKEEPLTQMLAQALIAIPPTDQCWNSFTKKDCEVLSGILGSRFSSLEPELFVLKIFEKLNLDIYKKMLESHNKTLWDWLNIWFLKANTYERTWEIIVNSLKEIGCENIIDNINKLCYFNVVDTVVPVPDLPWPAFIKKRITNDDCALLYDMYTQPQKIPNHSFKLKSEALEKFFNALLTEAGVPKEKITEVENSENLFLSGINCWLKHTNEYRTWEMLVNALKKIKASDLIYEIDYLRRDGFVADNIQEKVAAKTVIFDKTISFAQSSIVNRTDVNNICQLYDKFKFKLKPCHIESFLLPLNVPFYIIDCSNYEGSNVSTSKVFRLGLIYWFNHAKNSDRTEEFLYKALEPYRTKH